MKFWNEDMSGGKQKQKLGNCLNKGNKLSSNEIFKKRTGTERRTNS